MAATRKEWASPPESCSCNQVVSNCRESVNYNRSLLSEVGAWYGANAALHWGKQLSSWSGAEARRDFPVTLSWTYFSDMIFQSTGSVSTAVDLQLFLAWVDYVVWGEDFFWRELNCEYWLCAWGGFFPVYIGKSCNRGFFVEYNLLPIFWLELLHLCSIDSCTDVLHFFNISLLHLKRCGCVIFCNKGGNTRLPGLLRHYSTIQYKGSCDIQYLCVPS